MPFLGQDWRSPGEQWVKTTDGWHRMRLWRMRMLDNLNENVLSRICRANQENLLQERVENQSQPHVFITKATRESSTHMTLAEAFGKLDMSGAVRDLRRHNYVFKLLQETIHYHLEHLSGSAQRVIFGLLQEFVSQAAQSHNNIQDLRQLLLDTDMALDRGVYHHLGSTQLWNRHRRALHTLINRLNDLDLPQRSDDGQMTLNDLPDDCIREILSRLWDHKDIENTALVNSRTQGLTEENSLWRDLCVFHFNDIQIRSVLKKDEHRPATLTTNSELDIITWKKLHTRLVKRYGLRDMYADMLQMCKLCHALHWKHHGHPCLLPDEPPATEAVPPSLCLELFEA